jgi:hypothetical protein
MNLYELSAEYQRLMDEVIQSDELSETLLSSIAFMHDSIEDKAKQIGKIIKNLEAEHCAIINAMQEMKQRADKLDNKIENIRDWLKVNMEKCDIKKINSPYFDIQIKNNPASVIIKDETLIPKAYFNEMIMRKVNKSLLSQELKNNIMIPGVFLEYRTRLEIK